MKMNQYDTVIDATKNLRRRGYTVDFVLKDGKMKNPDTDKRYEPSDMCVDEFHRFEGISNPADSSIVFAVSCKDDTKGLVVSAYGANASEKLDAFMDEVPVAEEADNR